MAMERTIYREIKATGSVWGLAILLGAFVAAAGGAVLFTEHHGHIVTGMNNQVVWGLPHVFAIFLIVAASGALNVASIASVFGKAPYKPLARFSAVLAIALLAGGLAVLVLDLGRPDRLLVAMTTYNFKSIFAWNIYLYTGFMAIVGAYLFVQMSRFDYKYVRIMGTAAFLWRLALTTGTGSIFGWLVARPGYDAAIMAPLFIAMSFSFGLAVFILVMLTLYKVTERPLGDALVNRMGNLLAIFIGAVVYFTAVQYLTAMYAAEHAGIVNFVLRDGGHVTFLFWVGQLLIGAALPLLLIYMPLITGGQSRPAWASVFVVLGGLAQVYVIVVGGQLYPLEIFPGYEVTSSFGDGVVATYAPKWPEVLLGLGGVAVALLIVGGAAKILRILPTDLSDGKTAQE